VPREVNKAPQVKTSLVIPCFNEADGIPQLCERLRPVAQTLRKDGEVEVVFVDDGSKDGTADVIRVEANGLPYRIVPHDRNRGIGAALKTGFAASVGEEVVTLDSDCTYDPERVVDLLRLLREGNDVVTGSPYHPKGEVVGVPGWRLLLSKGLSRLYWIILPGRLYTYTSCFRAYRRSILPSLTAESDGFLGVTQLLASAILHGARIAELPAQLTSRRYGQSKIKVVKVSLSHLQYLGHLLVIRLSGRAGSPVSTP